MRKYWIFAMAVFFIIGCSSKDVGKKDKLEDSFQSEEKADSIVAIDQESVVEETTEQTSEQPENKAEKVSSEDETILWKSYRTAKDAAIQAQSEKEYSKQVSSLLEAAVYAKALKRYDIEAWQYNNAAYAQIEGFKEKTKYQVVMNKLNSLELKVEINKYRAEVRKQLSKEKRLLSKAEGNLITAKKIDDKLERSSRTTTIASNILFVDEVFYFLKAGETK